MASSMLRTSLMGRRSMLAVLIFLLIGPLGQFLVQNSGRPLEASQTSGNNSARASLDLGSNNLGRHKPSPTRRSTAQLKGNSIDSTAPEKHPRKRAWPRGFIANFSESVEGDAIDFELVDGKRASGRIGSIERSSKKVIYLSGRLNNPEPGRFFFQRQTKPGKAGDFVGVIEFPASQTAYRIEPSGPNGAPELVERALGEVLCQRLPMPTGLATNQTAEIPPLNPGDCPNLPIPVYQNGIIVLESLHGAKAVAYLDFQGGYSTGWGGFAYARPQVSNDQIREVWRRVAEDFMPFTINVTTDLKVFQNAQPGSRQRVLITPTVTAAPEAGGVAYVGSFNWAVDMPCWVFSISGKACAEACSHELGHTLGIALHDGQGTNEYYTGQGSGDTGWAPIMGVGYSQNVSQWCRGEYGGATHPQDELAMIATQNNDVAYRPDDTGDTLATSRYLEVYSNDVASAEGTIGNTDDTDAFQFTTAGGAVALGASPVSTGPNLALAVSLYDASDALMLSNCPQDTLWAALNTNLPAGTYTFRVTGAGRNDPLTNGFSSYASLGYYSITGSVQNARLPDRFSIPEHSTNGTVVGTVASRCSCTDPLSYQIVSGNTGATFALDNAGHLAVSDNRLLDYSTLAAQTQFAVQFELLVNILDALNPSLSETNRRVLVAIQFVPGPPTITKEPQDVIVSAADGASFNVSAIGGSTFDPLNYQWFFDGTAISGATTAALILNDAQANSAGDYLVTVSNSLGVVTSTVAVLSVTPTLPFFTLQPGSLRVFQGNGASFFTAAIGSEPLYYQWRFNGIALPGQTQQRLDLSTLQSSNAGIYDVVASNSAGASTSSPAVLEVTSVLAWGSNDFGQTNVSGTLTNVVQISAGAQHTLALLRGGEVIAWGSGEQTNVPAGLGDVVAVAAGQNHSLALKTDGTVVAWGTNGQTQVPPGLSNVAAIAAGGGHSLVLNADGTVTAWGLNNDQQTSVPAGLTNVIAIAAGEYHSLALLGDGTVAAWGDNSLGQTTLPVGLSNIVAIAAGQNHSLALRSDGSVLAWGFNNTNYNQGIVPSGLANVVAVSAGDIHNLALDRKSDVIGWGSGSQASVPMNLPLIAGIAAGAAHSVVLAPDGPPFITERPLRQVGKMGSLVVLRSAATGARPLSYQWQLDGTNLPGATLPALLMPKAVADGNYRVIITNLFGSATSPPACLTLLDQPPIILTQPTNQTTFPGNPLVLQVAAVGSHQLWYQWYFDGQALPRATNATLLLPDLLMGQAGYYSVLVSNALGTVTSTKVRVTEQQVVSFWGNRLVQVNVPDGLTGVIRLAAGSYHILALESDGTVIGWKTTSFNEAFDYGQASVPPNLAKSVAIAAGRYHSLALMADGTVRAWGAGTPNSKQSGYYNCGQSTVPLGLTNVVAIAAGDCFSAALKTDGQIVVWGSDTELGVNNVASAPLNAVNLVAIAANSGSLTGLKGDGSVVSWGSFAQRPSATNGIAIAPGAVIKSDGTVTSYFSPPTGLSHVVQIACYGYGWLARKDDGSVVAWGSPPNAVPDGLTNLIDIACGNQYCLATIGDGTLVITEPPHNRLVPYGGTTLLSVLAAGAKPINYQWQQNGSDLPEATNSWLRLTNFQSADIGSYRVVLSNALGTVVSKEANLDVLVPPIQFGSALNATNFLWASTGNAAWFTETNVVHNGEAAAQSGPIMDSQMSALQTTLIGPGTLSFWWKVSSEPFFDFLNFSINGQVLGAISGEVDWELEQFDVPAGTNVLSWTYAKDSAVSVGMDAGWLSEVAYQTNAPMIIQQPISQVIQMGSPVRLNVSAVGGPPLDYQWIKNGTNLAGAVSTSFVITNCTRHDSGTYAVVVSNPGGQVLSSNAHVQVLVPQRSSSPSWSSQTGLTVFFGDADGAPLSSQDVNGISAQFSTNLINWLPLGESLVLTNGLLLITDPDATNNSARFYRTIEQ